MGLPHISFNVEEFPGPLMGLTAASQAGQRLPLSSVGPRHPQLLLGGFGFQTFLSENTFSLAFSAWWCKAALLSVCVVVGKSCPLQLAGSPRPGLGCSWEGDSPAELGAGGGRGGADTSFPLSSSWWAESLQGTPSPRRIHISAHGPLGQGDLEKCSSNTG